MMKTYNEIMLLLTMLSLTKAVLPPQNPPWPPTYNMTESLISMQFNYSDFSSPSFGAQFGIISYDWSNMKAIWATQKPMNCEELLLEQAIQTKEAGAKHVFVYRNIVKALPWFSSVREKLNDPAYEGFFLKFEKKKKHYHAPPCAAENETHCSTLYHDQLQTPEVPTASNPLPDGACLDYCDCGVHPCGEYLFDHRNGTMLREFLVNELINSSTAIAHEAIDGLFLDDFWCSNLICEETGNATAGCPCNDPTQGATEIDAFQQDDMGLTDENIRNITLEWNKTMGIIQQTILNQSAYTWSLMAGEQNANAWPNMLNRKECAETLRFACHRNTQWQQLPMFFGFSVNETGGMTQFHQDLAFFLLVRGPYAWAGWGIWGMTWPPEQHVPHALKEVDYGKPLGVCFEWAQGVFVREWSGAQVELNCNTFEARIDHNSQWEIEA